MKVGLSLGSNLGDRLQQLRQAKNFLLDAQLLSQVYVELTGGRQIGLGLVSDVVADTAPSTQIVATVVRPPRVFAVAEADRARHTAFLKTVVNPLWGSDPAMA